jgi:hypothetical protein
LLSSGGNFANSRDMNSSNIKIKIDPPSSNRKSNKILSPKNQSVVDNKFLSPPLMNQSGIFTKKRMSTP